MAEMICGKIRGAMAWFKDASTVRPTRTMQSRGRRKSKLLLNNRCVDPRR
jgi:hypothetical protein